MVVIKPTTDKDIRLIYRLSREIFPITYQDILSKEQLEYMTEWMYSEESLKKQFEEGHRYYIAYVDGKPAGYVSIRKEDENVFHLEKLYVLLPYQKTGLGKELFNHAMKMIKNIHPEKCEMHLNVNRHNKALSFYKKMGMKEIEKGDFSIGNGYYMNDYIMSITIE